MRLLLILLLTTLVYGQRPNSIRNHHIIDGEIDSTKIEANTKALFTNENSSNIVKYYSDTTALKAETSSEVKQAYITQVGASGVGGGEFVYKTSGYTSDGVTVFDHSTSGYWVRKEWLDDVDRIKVIWAGAIGDGSTDDADAITRALATGIKKIVFEEDKVYRVTSLDFQLPVNTIIEGNNSQIYVDYKPQNSAAILEVTGNNVTIDGLNIKENPAKQDITEARSAFGIRTNAKYDNLVIRNVNIDSIKGTGISINNGGDNILIDNVNITACYDSVGGSGTGLSFQSVTNSIVSNSKFNFNINRHASANSRGFTIAATSRYIQVINCTANDNDYDGFTVQGSSSGIPQNIQFINCTAERNLNWAGLHLTGNSPIYGAYNVLVSNCSFRFNLYGFNSSSGKESHLVNCNLDSNIVSGANFEGDQSTRGSTITGGSITGNGSAAGAGGSQATSEGLILDQKDITISNVTIKGSYWSGIKWGQARNTVTNCRIYDNGTAASTLGRTAGIYFIGSDFDSSTVNNNLFYNTSALPNNIQKVGIYYATNTTESSQTTVAQKNDLFYDNTFWNIENYREIYYNPQTASTIRRRPFKRMSLGSLVNIISDSKLDTTGGFQNWTIHASGIMDTVGTWAAADSFPLPPTYHVARINGTSTGGAQAAFHSIGSTSGDRITLRHRMANTVVTCGMWIKTSLDDNFYIKLSFGTSEKTIISTYAKGSSDWQFFSFSLKIPDGATSTNMLVYSDAGDTFIAAPFMVFGRLDKRFDQYIYN